jgi:hypothetical protein
MKCAKFCKHFGYKSFYNSMTVRHFSFNADTPQGYHMTSPSPYHIL